MNNHRTKPTLVRIYPGEKAFSVRFGPTLGQDPDSWGTFPTKQEKDNYLIKENHAVARYYFDFCAARTALDRTEAESILGQKRLDFFISLYGDGKPTPVGPSISA